MECGAVQWVRWVRWVCSLRCLVPDVSFHGVAMRAKPRGPWYVYVVRFLRGLVEYFYVGMTDNTAERERAHRRGEVAWTRGGEQLSFRPASGPYEAKGEAATEEVRLCCELAAGGNAGAAEGGPGRVRGACFAFSRQWIADWPPAALACYVALAACWPGEVARQRQLLREAAQLWPQLGRQLAGKLPLPEDGWRSGPTELRAARSWAEGKRDKREREEREARERGREREAMRAQLEKQRKEQREARQREEKEQREARQREELEREERKRQEWQAREPERKREEEQVREREKARREREEEERWREELERKRKLDAERAEEKRRTKELKQASERAREEERVRGPRDFSGRIRTEAQKDTAALRRTELQRERAKAEEARLMKRREQKEVRLEAERLRKEAEKEAAQEAQQPPGRK